MYNHEHAARANVAESLVNRVGGELESMHAFTNGVIPAGTKHTVAKYNYNRCIHQPSVHFGKNAFHFLLQLDQAGLDLASDDAETLKNTIGLIRQQAKQNKVHDSVRTSRVHVFKAAALATAMVKHGETEMSTHVKRLTRCRQTRKLAQELVSRRLVQPPLVPNNEKTDANTKLIEAVRDNLVLEAEFALKGGADANAFMSTPYNRSLIDYAMSEGNAQMVTVLLKNGAVPTTQEKAWIRNHMTDTAHLLP